MPVIPASLFRLLPEVDPRLHSLFLEKEPSPELKAIIDRWVASTSELAKLCKPLGLTMSLRLERAPSK